MALHIVPEQEEGHRRDEACPCRPAKKQGLTVVGVGRQRRPYRGVIVTHRLFAEAPDAADAECGHVIVTDPDSGEVQHHDIPDDTAPHAPTSECGCSPQRHTVDGHVVYVHHDQDAADAGEDGGPR